MRNDVSVLRKRVSILDQSGGIARESSKACLRARDHERRQRMQPKALLDALVNASGTVPVHRKPLNKERLQVLKARHQKRKADMKAKRAAAVESGAKQEKSGK